MKKAIILSGIFFSVGTLLAQPFSSRLGNFQVDYVSGCVPFSINFKSILAGECQGGTPCSIDFLGNGQGITVSSSNQTFTYNQVGDFTIKVLYGKVDPTTGVQIRDDLSIKVRANIQPVFEVSTCSGDKAIVRITDSNYPEYKVGDFGDGFSTPFGSVKNFQHPYNTLSPFYPNFNVRVRGIYKNMDGTYAADNCDASSQPFKSLPALASPQINTLTAGDLLTATDPSQARLDFTPQANTQTRIDIAVNNATNFQQLKNSFGVTSETVTNLNLDNNYYCFRLSAFDPCTSLPIASTIVGPICSHRFSVTAKDGIPTAPNGIMQLDWQTSSSTVLGIDVWRDDKLLFGPLPGVDISYDDSDPSLVKCNTEYRYKIISNYNGGGKSISLEKRAKSFTTLKPATIVNTSSVVSTNGVQLNWIQDPKSTTTAYYLFRSQNQGTFFSLATSPTTQYQDATYNSNADFCYLINYKDQCNNGSLDSSPICPIRLRGSLNNRNEVSLSWNDYTGWNQGVANYLIEKYDQNGTLLGSAIDLGNSKVYSESTADLQNQIVSYRVIANPKELGLTQQSKSNQVTIIKDINLFYPTAFTPDRKGPTENENFKVGGQFIAKFEISIFDRWGSLIFFTDKNEPWDGTQNGLPMPVATYVWTANIVDMAGRSLKRSGTILLLRK